MVREEVEAEEDGFGGRTSHSGTAGDGLGLLEDVLSDEDQAQGEDGQIEAAHACGQGGEHEGDERGHQAGEWQPDHHVEAEADDLALRLPTKDGRGVGADAHEERLTERHLAGVPREDIEPDPTDGEDEHRGEQCHHVALQEEGDDRHRDDPGDDPVALDAGVEDRHLARVTCEELGPPLDGVQ